MKKLIIAVVIIIILVGVGFFFFIRNSKPAPVDNGPVTTVPTTTPQVPVNKDQESIGKSVEGRDITAYHFGSGDKELVFVGGIHGGYEWNTTLVAHELIDYLKANPAVVPTNLKVTVIPVLNPDGLFKIVGTTDKFTAADVPKGTDATVPGRFNANNVDLNRNFECDWKAQGTWQNKTVSGGTAAFSEPESLAMKNYIESNDPAAVVVWYSSAGGVFASSCHNGVLPETNTLTQTFAKAAGYPAHQTFNFYEITGDMVNWLAKNNVPAISVLLTNHTDPEWSKNKAGIEALFKLYGAGDAMTKPGDAMMKEDDGDAMKAKEVTQ